MKERIFNPTVSRITWASGSPLCLKSFVRVKGWWPVTSPNHQTNHWQQLKNWNYVFHKLYIPNFLLWNLLIISFLISLCATVMRPACIHIWAGLSFIQNASFTKYEERCVNSCMNLDFISLLKKAI